MYKNIVKLLTIFTIICLIFSCINLPSYAANPPTHYLMFNKFSGAQDTMTYVTVLPIGSLQAITHNSGSILTQGSDYTISGSAVTISTTYMLGLSTGVHTFTLDYGASGSATISIYVYNSAPSTLIVHDNTTFNKHAEAIVDLKIETALPTVYLTSIEDVTGNRFLQLGSDYTLSGNNVIINKQYLSVYGVGNVALNFNYGPLNSDFIQINIINDAPSLTKPVVAYSNAANTYKFLQVFQKKEQGDIYYISGRLMNSDSDKGSLVNISSAKDNLTAPLNQDVAYDNTSNRYLVVWQEGIDSTTSTIKGRLINAADGSFASSVITISSSSNAKGPSVAYDYESQSFLVTFGSTDGSTAIRGRYVSIAGDLNSPGDLYISNKCGSIESIITKVASDANHGGSVVSWVYQDTSNQDIYYKFVRQSTISSGEGTIIPGSTDTISVNNTIDIAFDYVHSKFLIAWQNNSQSCIKGYVLYSDGAGLSQYHATFNITADNSATSYPSVIYASGKYLMSYTRLISSINYIYGLSFDYDGNLGNAFLISNNYPDNCSYSSLAYDSSINNAVAGYQCWTSLGKNTLFLKPPLSISTASLTPAVEGVLYNLTLSAAGSNSFAWSASGLPEGLSIDTSTGQISGTPVSSGLAYVTVNVSDANWLSTTKTYLLNIHANGMGPYVEGLTAPYYFYHGDDVQADLLIPVNLKGANVSEIYLDNTIRLTDGEAYKLSEMTAIYSENGTVFRKNQLRNLVRINKSYIDYQNMGSYVIQNGPHSLKLIFTDGNSVVVPLIIK